MPDVVIVAAARTPFGKLGGGLSTILAPYLGAAVMENMSRAPYLIERARFGYGLGDGQLVDSLVHDGLTDPANGCHMAVEASDVASEFEVSRERQDEYAFRSQRRYADALAAGRLREEIIPVTVPAAKGAATVSADEQPRPETTLEGLRKLQPIFKEDGSITAGNAPGVNDGAAALLLMSGDEARRRRLPVLAEWLGFGESADNTPTWPRCPRRRFKQRCASCAWK